MTRIFPSFVTSTVSVIILALLFIPQYCLADTYSSWHKLSSLKPKTDNSFTYNNKIISPLCVALLSSKPTHPFSSVASVDLAGCQSNMLIKKQLYTNAHFGFLYFIKHDNYTRGYFDYQIIGRTTNGLYVLKTTQGLGKLGTYPKIQIIKLEKDHVYHYQNPISQTNSSSKQLTIRTRDKMLLMGEINSGLGCDFGIKQARLSSNTLSVDYFINPADFTLLKKRIPSQIKTSLLPNRNAKQCIGFVTYTYNLQLMSEPVFNKIKLDGKEKT